MFDGKIINSTDTIDLFFEKLGNHKLEVETADRAGNPSNEEVKFRITATFESTILDIERAFSLGWINKKGVKESLTHKLLQAIRLDNKIDKILIKGFLNELDAQHNKHINDQAFNLLTEDVSWLLND